MHTMGEKQATFRLRPAVAGDQAEIRRLVREGKINPFGLDWPRFIVAVDPTGKQPEGLLGCGQVRQHGDGTRELASIAVDRRRRGEGIARAIIEALLAQETAELYLICRSHMGDFYRKFGFTTVDPASYPRYFRRIYRMFLVAEKLHLGDSAPLIMKWSPKAAPGAAGQQP